jgi:signal peptidase I
LFVVDVMDPVIAPDIDDEDDEPAKRSYTKELWFLLVVALALALTMKTFLIQAFFIPSGSMEQTLHGCAGCQGDRVLVNKLVYKFRDVHRGEIVVFNGKGTNFSSEAEIPPPKNQIQRILRNVQSLVGFGAPSEKDFIKRVIGIPGDTVACCTDGKVTVNGQPIEEPYVYLTDDTNPQSSFEPVTVPEGELFLMGDHRDGSSDSRYNGTVPISSVVGRAFAVFYPPGRAKVLGVPDTFDPRAAAAAPHVLGFAMAVPITVVRRRLRRTTD